MIFKKKTNEKPVNDVIDCLKKNLIRIIPAFTNDVTKPR